MFVPELLCRSIHTSNNGALTATRQHKTGLLTATLNKKTSQQPCLQMAEHTYPSEVAVAAYISGDATTVSRRVAFVAEHFPDRTREFSWDAVLEVGQHFCAQRLYSKTTSWIKRSLGKGNAAVRTFEAGSDPGLSANCTTPKPSLAWKRIMLPRDGKGVVIKGLAPRYESYEYRVSVGISKLLL